MNDHRATLGHSGWVERSSSGLGPSQNHLVHGFGSVTLKKDVKVSFCRKGQSKIVKYFRRKAIWYTATTPVSLRKNFSCSMPLTSGGSSLILLRLFWRQFYYINKHLSILPAHAVRMKETYASIQGLLKKYVKKTASGIYMVTWSCGNADWAARRLYESLFRPMWMGQPSEPVATPSRNDSRSEKCSTYVEL
jgi:hypothetical protein